MKLLVVEDHPDLGILLCRHLERAGHVVDHAATASQAEILLGLSHYEMLILDLGLPDKDGLSLLKKLRRNQQASHSFCLILSARDAIENRISGLEAGADDYLTKPFDMSELEARIRAISRRPKQVENTRLSIGNMRLEPARFELVVAHDTVTMARREFALLEMLMRQPYQILNKQDLVSRLYSWDEDSSANAIEALVSRLRRKMRALKADCRIETVHGLGYRLLLPDNDTAT